MQPTNFDIADYLDNKEVIAEYLNTALEEGDSADLVEAMGNVAKAMGMTKVAHETGMSRTSLYKALTHDSNPQLETIQRVLKAIGGRLNIQPL